MLHQKDVLIIKRMVQDLLHIYKDSREPDEALDRLRDLVERAVGNPDIPLEVYEWSDTHFLRWAGSKHPHRKP
jgi:hypothetical protein